MECNHARLLLTFARDRADLDSVDADGLEDHVGHCPECAALATAQRRLDLALGRAMRAVPVPAGLKERLLARLPRPPRRWRRWVVSTAALAASLLLTVGVIWHFWLQRTPIDPDALDLRIYTFTSATPEDVEKWFGDRGLTMAYPARFNERRLEAIEIAMYQGKRVPKLLFVHRGEHGRPVMAHVYFLSQDQFDLSTKPVSTLPGSDSNTVCFGPRKNGYLYLVVYTGGSLAPFEVQGGKADQA